MKRQSTTELQSCLRHMFYKFHEDFITFKFSPDSPECCLDLAASVEPALVLTGERVVLQVVHPHAGVIRRHQQLSMHVCAQKRNNCIAHKRVPSTTLPFPPSLVPSPTPSFSSLLSTPY